ncbi:MAG: sulfatase [Planctomycetota bacterium]|jgi:arylsulfatase A-like enzyme
MSEAARQTSAGVTNTSDALARVRSATSLAARVQTLAELERSGVVGVEELGAAVSALAEQECVFDETARLLRTWHHHRRGEDAERDYYLHAFPRADQRSMIRRALGIDDQWHAERLVMLVTVDCLRADRLSCNSYARPTTPAMDSLAREGLSFRRAYATAGATPQSFVGIFLSNFFQNVGTSRGLPEHLVTLAELLCSSGFHTVGFNAANVLISHFYGYGRGFGEFYDFFEPRDIAPGDETFVASVTRSHNEVSEREVLAVRREFEKRADLRAILLQITGKDQEALVRHIAGLRRYNYDAADLAKCTIRSLRENQGRRALFYWLHLMDCHEPVTVPFARLGCYSPVEQFFLNACVSSPVGRAALSTGADKYGQLYDSAVSYVDLNLGILVAFLADSGLLEQSLICVTADHGQELLEDGVFGHAYDRLSETVVHVPLIFGGGLARQIDAAHADRPVSCLDIAPTILDVCGIAPPATFLGRTLNDTEQRPIYGQSFYDGVRNRAPDKTTRRLFLKPHPRPVKEHCKEMFFCIEGAHQIIYDAGSDKTELHGLRSCTDGRTSLREPEAAALIRKARTYFEETYDVPEQDEPGGPSEQEMETVERRLEHLGYL